MYTILLVGLFFGINVSSLNSEPSSIHNPLQRLRLIQSLVASLPEATAPKTSQTIRDLLTLLRQILAQDPYLYRLVDKQHALPADYVPPDLVSLDNQDQIVVNRRGMFLRHETFMALQNMSRVARASNITLDVSSAYRSYAYQENLFARHSRNLGLQEAERVSARAGTSQHQLGTVIDFGSITEAYAATKAFAWLQTHGSTFGFSLSYPDGFEWLTGYIYEPWHYRYVGAATCRLIDYYFNGIQQHALVWLQKQQNTIRLILE
jgi:zinc D-Ala-D-Ala carboxypeptidase